MQQISRRLFLRGAGATLAALSLPGGWLRPPAAAGSGPTDSEVDRILAAALEDGGHYADLFLETRTRTSISIADSEIRSMEYGIIQGGGVRTLSGEKTGYAFSESLDAEDLTRAAKTAASIARRGAPTRPVSVSEIAVPEIIGAEEPIGDTPIGAKVALLERVDRAARAAGGAIGQVNIDYTDEAQRFSIANSAGIAAHDETPVIYLRVTVTATRNGVNAEGSYRLSARRGMELLAGEAPERAGREAAEQAIRMLDARPAPTGEMPVVVAAGGGVMFHEAVGHGLEADAVIRNASVFAGRVGERVASDLVTLYDDGTVPGARGSFNIDDEGTLPSKSLLIEKGRLIGYMQDRRTAHRMRESSTGNGRRMSYRHPVVVRMSNTYVAPGSADPEEVIRDTDRGIYAVSFGGGEVDPGSGQFTFGLREAYLIENGRVTAPIRGANLVGSGPDVLLGIDRVASDYDVWPGTCGKADQWVPVTSGCPTLRIAKLTVGGTA
ncbi:MAG: hypothetical protein GF330_00120 [Candidatus Eisenbacteria bacterium]|nr:hypothetical protein [Candidatus Eisenbacteria bacterium]